eukprot:s39_g2.t1
MWWFSGACFQSPSIPWQFHCDTSLSRRHDATFLGVGGRGEPIRHHDARVGPVLAVLRHRNEYQRGALLALAYIVSYTLQT